VRILLSPFIISFYPCFSEKCIKYFLQDPENLQLGAANDDRCFTCGEKGHWQSMCTTQKPATVNELLFKAECCSNCGIPIKAVDGTQLHAGVAGKYCTFPRHFLEVGAFVVKFLSNVHALMLLRVCLYLKLT
jgi:hypothetical protein